MLEAEYPYLRLPASLPVAPVFFTSAVFSLARLMPFAFFAFCALAVFSFTPFTLFTFDAFSFAIVLFAFLTFPIPAVPVCHAAAFGAPLRSLAIAFPLALGPCAGSQNQND